MICCFVCFMFTWLGSVDSAMGKVGGDRLPVDMGTWLQRDWAECKTTTKFQYTNNTVRFVSEGSAALLWQIPTRSGRPMALDPDRYPWIGKCKRPPRNFEKAIRKRGFDTLIDVAENPYLTWRWKVDYSTIGRQRLDKGGRLKKQDDDFSAKLGIAILEKGTNNNPGRSPTYGPIHCRSRRCLQRKPRSSHLSGSWRGGELSRKAGRGG